MSQPTELEKLKSERKVIRGSLTRVINFISDIFKTPESFDETKCEEMRDQLIAKAEHIVKLDENIKRLITDLGLLESEIEKCVEYSDNVTSAKCKIDKIIKNKQKDENVINYTANLSESSINANVKEGINNISHLRLPKLIIEPFDGKYENWQGFWGQYQGAFHENTQLSKIDKFQYLKGFLRNSALSCIQGLTLTEDNYDLAIELLKERFGKNELIIRTHVNKLLCLNPVKSSSNLKELRELHDICTIHIRNLQTAGVEPDNYGGILYAILIKLIPEDIILNYNRNTSEDKTWNCNKLLEFLKNEIKTREKTFLLRKTEESEKYKNKEFSYRKSGKLGSTAMSRDTHFKNGSNSGRYFYDRYKSQNWNVGKEKVPTAAALTSTIKTDCLFCNQNSHESDRCKNLNLDDKKLILKKQGRCWRCLKKFHLASGCQASIKDCEICSSKRHMTVMCNKNPKESSSENSNEGQTVVSSLTHDKCPSTKKKVILQTCRVVASSGFKSKVQFCLFDSASEKTFITESLAKELDLKPIRYEKLQICAFGSGEPMEKNYEVVRLKLRNCDYPKRYVRVEALVTDVISAASIRFCKQNKIQKPTFDLPQFEVVYIDSNELAILIGMDYYYIANKGNVQKISQNLYSCETLFGTTLQGQVLSGETSPNVHVMKVTANSIKEEPWRDINFLWKLEALGLCDDGSKSELDALTLKDFEENIKFVNGRYETKLIWDTNNKLLGNNFDVAKKRFSYLTNKLKTDKELLNSYSEIIKEQLKTGIVEECSRSESGDEYFMPHKPVIKDDKLTTKVRIVYDASSKAKNTNSLNDCLLPGPNLNPNILDVILKFREYRIAFSADIEKAFHQISVTREDREFLKFLWLNENNHESWKILRMTRVPFGATCSSFLLGATIKYHLRKYEATHVETCNMLNETLYVDDLYSGSNTLEHASKLSLEAVDILKDANMNLRKFTTNSSQLRDFWSLHEIPQNEVDSENSMKVLGLKWNNIADVLNIELKSILESLKVIKFTKRFVLQIAATLFDPVGFVTPFTIRIKCLIQDIWTLGLDWDDDLPFEIREKFLNWCNEITHLHKFYVDRNYFCKPAKEKEIHIFSDASPRAYGAVAYFRYLTDDNTVETSFIISKARVSPLKKLTLPRLELMSAVIAAKLAKYLKSLFKIPTEEIILWTDSSITYYWIRGSASQWKPFVSNRVREIQEHTRPQNWNHIKSKFNPADLLTRGEKLESLIDNKTWSHGPEWLRYHENSWPRTKKIKNRISAEIDSEYNSNVAVSATIVCKKIIDPEKFSSLSRLLRITALVLRFIDILKKKNVQKGPLLAEELENAEKFWVKNAQADTFLPEITCLKNHKPLPKDSKLICLNPRLDQEDILRVTGRLGKARFLMNEKNPIILSPKSKLVELIIRDSHERVFHSGVSHTMVQVREKYWILRARQAVRSFLQNCVICKRFNSSPGDQSVAPLPADRVEEAAPFSVIGLDFAGPLYTKDNSSKQYILLITCAVTRGLHLELVSSLTTDTFLLAFRRFISRRGLCSIVYSDNARTFKRAELELKQIWSVINHPEAKKFYASNNIKWKYIVERAAWWGGFYERMVRTVKNALRKTLGKCSLNVDQLQTALIEIEGMVNSRPITYVGNDSDEPNALTPAHFIVGKRISSLPSVRLYLNPNFSSRKDFIKAFNYRENLMKSFWLRWKNEYLLNLRSAHCSSVKSNISEFKVNDIILIKDDHLPRNFWKLGRILKLFPGRDGKVRSCEIKTTSSIIRRPVQLLYNLD